MGDDLDKAINSCLQKRKRRWSKTFKYCTTTFVKEWILKYNGETKFGEKYEVNVNGNKIDSGLPSKGKTVPLWRLFMWINNGKRKSYYRHGLAYLPCNVRVRSVGVNNNIKFEGCFEVETKDSWKPV